MRFLVASLIVICALAIQANAYPADQYDECILTAKANPVVANVPESSIEDFCDCALTEILDKGNDQKSSAQTCVKKTLN